MDATSLQTQSNEDSAQSATQTAVSLLHQRGEQRGLTYPTGSTPKCLDEPHVERGANRVVRGGYKNNLKTKG